MASSDRGNLSRGIENCLGVAPSVVGFPRDGISCDNPGWDVPLSVGPGTKKNFLVLLSLWTIYSATTFLENCRKVVREKWFKKSGSRNLVREKCLTRKKGGFIL